MKNPNKFFNKLIKIFNNPNHKFWEKYIIIDKWEESEVFDLLLFDKKYNSESKDYLIIPRKLYDKLKEQVNG